MKVYVVTFNSGSIDEGTDTKIVGVYSNKTAAEVRAKEVEQNDPYFNSLYDYADVEVREVQE